MTAVSDWSSGFFTGLTAGLTRFFGAIPNIIGATVLLIIGWSIAGFIGGLFTKLCRTLQFDMVSARVGVADFLQRSGTRLNASDIMGEIIKWVIRLVFIEMAAEQLGMPQVSQIINQILGFIPNILVAVVILAVGALLGKILGVTVYGGATQAKLENATLLSRLSSGAVMTFAIIAALNELNIAPIVVDTLYIGVVAALALGLGLAFGLGGRDTAARLTEQWVGRLNKTAKQHSAVPAERPERSVRTTTVSGSTGL